MRRVLLFGAAGRMGRLAIEELAESTEFGIVTGVEHPSNPQVGETLQSVPVISDQENYPETDVWLDFSLAEPAISHIRAAAKLTMPIVVASTGFSDAQVEVIKECSTKCPLFLAPNLSIGAAVLEQLATATRKLLPSEFDAVISELHHTAKKDAPSGTARKIADSMATVGDTPEIISLRGGNVTGEHSVRFIGRNEEIIITHRAWSRSAFSRGIATALSFISTQSPGLYGMLNLVEYG